MGWLEWKEGKGKGKRGGRESGEGGIGGVAGTESEKRDREREGGAAGKVRGWKCRVRLGYLLFRFSFLLYFF